VMYRDYALAEDATAAGGPPSRLHDRDRGRRDGDVGASLTRRGHVPAERATSRRSAGTGS
jgi:hypothetical protein